MSIYLTEQDVSGLLDMKSTLEILDKAFKAQAEGKAVNRSRQRIPLSNGMYNVMSASDYSRGVVGLKAYTATSNGAKFHVLLYDAEGKGLLAVIEAGFLGKLRTGAATGLATRYMAAEPANGTAAIIGAGNQAQTQIEALVAAGTTKKAVVFSPTPARREQFAKEMSEKLGIEVSPVESAESAISGASTVTVITNSQQPVFKADWLRPGLHINAAGNNTWLGQEIETSAIGKFDVVVTDDVDQARIESGELMRAAETGQVTWPSVIPLAEVVAGSTKGRRSEQDITLFESQGVALEDISVAHHVYTRALESGVGLALPGA
ncbi:MAG: ornithine cyclodeaminase family protein [Dehalococcoidia bacterium]